MNFTSLKHLSESSRAAFRRFPLALLFALIGTICMWYMVKETTFNEQVFRLLMISYLGMVIFTAFSIFFERYHFRKTTVFLALCAVVAFLVYYFYSLPVELNLKSYSRFIMLILAAHLGVSFAPFLVDIEINGFWQYNKTLFLRFLSSVLYSIVLFIGLSLALLAIDKLFAIKIETLIYLRLWCLVSGLFNTLFFLSGVPENVEQLENDHSYPKGLRIFTQFVLLPLVTFYLLILYAYTAKIVFTIVWPRGWVSYLVIGCSTLGILALLLVWPRKEEEKHKWIRTYIRTFFIALFPLIVVLGFAIGRRVKAYGVTENRYFVIVLAVWLFINALYFLFSKLKNIKFIPMSLFVVTLLSGYGPWSSFSISEHSQRHRLKMLFKKYQLMKGGYVLKAPDHLKLKDDDLAEIGSVTAYLCKEHGVNSLQPIFHQRLDSLLALNANGNYIDKPGKILQSINLDYRLNDNVGAITTSKMKQFNFSARGNEAFNVCGFDYEVPFSIYTSSTDKVIHQSCVIDSSVLNWTYKRGGWNIILTYDNHGGIEMNCKSLIDTLITKNGRSDYQIAQHDFFIYSENENMKAKFFIRAFSGVINNETGELELSSLDGQLFLKVK